VVTYAKKEDETDNGRQVLSSSSVLGEGCHVEQHTKSSDGVARKHHLSPLNCNANSSAGLPLL
jgi:hypothetical protein